MNNVIKFEQFEKKDDKTLKEISHEMVDTVFDEAPDDITPDNLILLATDPEGQAAFLYTKHMSNAELIGRLKIITDWVTKNTIETGDIS